MIDLLAGFALLIIAVLLYRRYQIDKSYKSLMLGVLFIALAFVFTALARSMIVYRPLMIIHIALTIASWWGVFLYLLRKRINLWLLLSPMVTVLLFFLMAYIFDKAQA